MVSHSGMNFAQAKADAPQLWQRVIREEHTLR